jgi:hypothetical protein
MADGKQTEPSDRNTARATISLTPEIMEKAQNKAKGSPFRGNFSAYIEALIVRDLTSDSGPKNHPKSTRG